MPLHTNRYTGPALVEGEALVASADVPVSVRLVPEHALRAGRLGYEAVATFRFWVEGEMGTGLLAPDEARALAARAALGFTLVARTRAPGDDDFGDPLSIAVRRTNGTPHTARLGERVRPLAEAGGAGSGNGSLPGPAWRSAIAFRSGRALAPWELGLAEAPAPPYFYLADADGLALFTSPAQDDVLITL